MEEAEDFRIWARDVVYDVNDALTDNQRAVDDSATKWPPSIDRMSSAGRCYRERWAVRQGVPLDPGRGFAARPDLMRLLRLGHVIEDEVVALLEEAGYCVVEQQREVRNLEGTWVGHIDGIIYHGQDWPRRSLLEIKSASRKRFDALLDLGYQKWDAKYAGQLQAYMHHLEGIEDAVAVVYCKDSSRMYAERILYDFEAATELEKAHELVMSEGEIPPPRPRNAKSQYCAFCKWCDRNEWCWSPATDIQFDD